MSSSRVYKFIDLLKKQKKKINEVTKQKEQKHGKILPIKAKNIELNKK